MSAAACLPAAMHVPRESECMCIFPRGALHTQSILEMSRNLFSPGRNRALVHIGGGYKVRYSQRKSRVGIVGGKIRVPVKKRRRSRAGLTFRLGKFAPFRPPAPRRGRAHRVEKLREKFRRVACNVQTKVVYHIVK